MKRYYDVKCVRCGRKFRHDSRNPKLCSCGSGAAWYNSVNGPLIVSIAALWVENKNNKDGHVGLED